MRLQIGVLVELFLVIVSRELTGESMNKWKDKIGSHNQNNLPKVYLTIKSHLECNNGEYSTHNIFTKAYTLFVLGTNETAAIQLDVYLSHVHIH